MTAPITPRYDPAFLAWNTVAGYDDYEQAQATVDKLSAQGFPVEHLDIVGSDLRSIERIAGKITRSRAALAGASQGVWFGLFVGLMLSILSGGTAAVTILVAMLVGAAAGAGTAYVARTSLKGRRTFASTRTFVAGHYDIVARDGFAEQAREALLRSEGTSL